MTNDQNHREWPSFCIICGGQRLVSMGNEEAIVSLPEFCPARDSCRREITDMITKTADRLREELERVVAAERGKP